MILFKGIKLGKIAGIALWPFVLVKSKKPSKTILNHEKIHLKQQQEMLLILFYVWYMTEWAIRYVALRDFNRAYRNICFEREAYTHEADLHYLENRKSWAFLRYLG